MRYQPPLQTGVDYSEKWQTLMRWLLHFLPGRHEVSVPRYSVVIRKI